MDISISRATISLRTQVINALRTAILEGKFAPGEKLIERELCEMLDVSRTLLREALQHLAAEGLIEHIPHKGPSVAVLDYKAAKNIYEVREVLEPLALTGFTEHATRDDLDKLRKVIKKLDKATEDDTQELLAIKNNFYEIILDACGNDIVRDMLTVLNNRITLLRRLSLGAKGRLPNTRREIRAIMDAVESRDTAAVHRLCTEHVQKAAQTALAKISKED